MHRSSLAAVSAAIIAFGSFAGAAWPQSDPFAGKSVQMIIGFGPGGGYDLWGRIVGRHIGRHLPGTPNVVPQNMPGAGSYTAANYIYNVAPKDGIGARHHRARRRARAADRRAGRALRRHEAVVDRHARRRKPMSASRSTPPR